MNPINWITGNDTGISSKAIWSVMMGADTISDTDVPHDPADFGRCYRLLKLFPEWRNRLDEVAAALPKWGPMVREWETMECLYEKDAATLYDFMQKLMEECFAADGWKKTGTGSWEKGPHFIWRAR
uniref:Uncharacterized protein n=1 Tax=viral metagenome TaxID=1070528 RepID=A0A6H1ZLZ2_9ZZZZ